MTDPYLNAAGVFDNLLGINEASALQQAETNLAELRGFELDQGLGPVGHFDSNHLRSLHQFLFQDVYPWAGRTRGDGLEINAQVVPALPLFAKGSSLFTISPRVNQHLDDLLNPIGKAGFAGSSKTLFLERATAVLGRLNAIHPFREGNGRTQRAFINALAQIAGHSLAWDVVSRERMISVSIDAVAGDLNPLRRLLEEIIDSTMVLELQGAIQFLIAQNINWNERYLAMAVPGRMYQGLIAARGKRYAILQTNAGLVIVTPYDQITKTDP